MQQPSTPDLMLRSLEISALLITACIIAFQATRNREDDVNRPYLVLFPAASFSLAGVFAGWYLLSQFELLSPPQMVFMWIPGGILMLGGYLLLLWWDLKGSESVP